jgi:AmmeMemoRadiSam system protein A
MTLPPAHHPTLLHIAAGVIRATLQSQIHPLPTDPDPTLSQPAGCFVSLHHCRDQRLRGCIGTMDTSRPRLEALVHAAGAVLADPRFRDAPVTLDELPDLLLEISLLSPLRPCPTCLDFDLLADGIYLTCSDRAGVFLPQVARETGWTREQLLARLCTEKMGLSATAWKSPDASLQTFTTLIIGPVPFPPLDPPAG